MTSSLPHLKALAAVSAVALLWAASSYVQAGPGTVGTTPEIEARVEALLAKMTLEEKLGQLSQRNDPIAQIQNPDARRRAINELEGMVRNAAVGSFLNAHGAEHINGLQRVAVEETRLGIPLLFGNDVIHGYRTISPIPLGEAASFEPKLAEKAARMAAQEASAAGTNWTFAPMVDITRDPRWGRIAEGAGEDPFLGSVMAAARVRGFQGSDLSSPDTMLACAKHYVAYGGAEAGRDYNSVDCSEQKLRELYLPPFRAAVEAGVGSLMSAFNEVNGIPASGNRFTLTEILRGQWGFNGFVVSDWDSIEEMVTHGFASDEAHAAELGIRAGVDMEMASTVYFNHLAGSLKKGNVPADVIDEAVRRVLRMKFMLGLFDRPYVDPKREKKVILCQEFRDIARDVARHSIVLLKNDDGILPLSDRVGALGVIGPLADSRRDPMGTWVPRGNPKDVVSVLQGIRERVSSQTNVMYAKGSGIHEATDLQIAKAVEIAERSDVVVLVIGEAEYMSGEAHCRTTLDLPEAQKKLASAVHATGTPYAVVLMNGRPMSINFLAEHAPAILETWHLGVECGHATADVLFGDFNPGGKLPVTFPRSVGQIPIYYNHKMTGRPPVADDVNTSKYIDSPWTPLFSFGHGLSYTKFEFSNLRLSALTIPPSGKIEVRVDITNVGDRTGDEVAQLYIRDLVARVTRPVRELKGFERITLRPGEQQTVAITLSSDELAYFDPRRGFIVEPGVFHVWVGPNSMEGLQGQFDVTAN